MHASLIFHILTNVFTDSPPIMYWLNIINEIQTESYIKIRSADISKFPKNVRSRQDKNHTIISI